MSKTKLAMLVFGLAFGLNVIAFVFSKKSFVVEEVKNLWIYEIPQSASPLDAYVALDLGPHQGVIGTLFLPNHLEGKQSLSPLLAGVWKWDQGKRELSVHLKPDLHYQNGDLILPEHFISFRDFLVSKGVRFESSPLWSAWLNSKITVSGDALVYSFPSSFGSDENDLEGFLSEVLTHALTGAVHPKNLEMLKQGEVIKKEWISSGPYKIRKWNPKEIVMVSREDFPIRLPAPFFRTLKFQSAPVKNPSCDFLLGKFEEQKQLTDHTQESTSLELTVFWVCRSFRGPGICKDPKARASMNRLLTGTSPVDETSPQSLLGQKVRYRIPEGSDAFRAEIRKRIQDRLGRAGATLDETSFFFKGSKDTDLELQFVVTPASVDRKGFALSLAHLSSRLGLDAMGTADLVGEVTHFPLSVYMKRMKGEMFGKVFLEPDLDEKKMPL